MFYVFVESRGCDDPQGCNAIIKVNDVDYAVNKRGFNIVVVDRKTGRHGCPKKKWKKKSKAFFANYL